jgi:hypothetical protein
MAPLRADRGLAQVVSLPIAAPRAGTLYNYCVLKHLSMLRATGVATWLVVIILVTAALYSTIVFLDPYSTGRFTPIEGVDITTDQPYYADAARVRNSMFDSAIVGNSHIMAIRPSRLNVTMGGSFVSLALPRAVPNEQALLVRLFAQHHLDHARFLIWSIDHPWCSSNPGERTLSSPLPFWLYQSSDGEYLSRILSPDSVNLSVRRALILLGLAGQAGPADGFDPDPNNLSIARRPPTRPASRLCHGRPRVNRLTRRCRLWTCLRRSCPSWTRESG